MRTIIEYPYTAANGVRFKIGDDGCFEQWRCLECFEFGRVTHEEDCRDTEAEAQKCADTHSLVCHSTTNGIKRKRRDLE